MPIRCPACGKESPDGARGCAHCPESFNFEDDPDYVKPNFRKIDPSSWHPVVWLVVSVAAGFFVYKALTFFMEMGEEGMKNPINRMVQYRTSVPDKASGALPGVDVTPGSAKVEMTFRKDSSDDASASADVSVWHLEGTVKDLTTLQPVADVDMVFEGGGSSVQDTTDPHGHYSVAAPPLVHGGYRVRITKEGYSSNYLNPGAQKVPQMPLEDRQGLAHDLNQNEDGPYEVQPVGSTPLTTDFYIAPKK